MLNILTSIINKYSATLFYVNVEYTNTYEYKSNNPGMFDGLYMEEWLGYNWRTPHNYSPYMNRMYSISGDGTPIMTNWIIPTRMAKDLGLLK